MKKKAQALKFLPILLLVIIILIFANLFAPASFIDRFSITLFTNSVERISETSDYAIYEVKFVDANPESVSCKELPSRSFLLTEGVGIHKSGDYFSVNQGVTSIFLTYDLSDLSREIEPEVVSLDMSNFAVANYVSCGGAYKGQAVISNENVKCEILSDKQMTCILSANVEGTSASGSISFPSGSFKVKFYKKGYIPITGEVPVDFIPVDDIDDVSDDAEELGLIAKINLWIDSVILKIKSLFTGK